jgi:mRNA interferase YafQ
MRTIEETTRFRRDYKREKKGVNGTKLSRQLATVLAYLVDDAPLPPKFRDHPLTGQWHDFRDCHVRPDLVLIYRKPTPDNLQLVRLGSHSELGL